MEARKVGVGVKKGPMEKKQFKTIVLVDLDEELLSRSLLQEHFSKYGHILKMQVSLKYKNAVINFSKASEAKAAKEQGGLILPHKPAVKMFYTEKGLEGGRSRPLVRTISTIKAPLASAHPAPPTPILAPTPSTSVPKPASIKVTHPPKAIPSLASVVPHPHPHPPQGDRDQHTFYPDTPEAQDIFSKRAVTAEERYRLLEARDKVIRARNPKVKMRVEFAVKLSGTSPDMCPEKERYMREVQRQLTSFEMTGKDYEVDHRLAVKAYARSSADQEEPLSHELRPSSTLEMSLSYILHNIIPKMDQIEDLANWYNFVWDRTRSIRKEITQQQLCDLRSVAMMEKCARFHIYCSSRLCELDRHAFDMKLNDENLMKCLQSLEHMYTDLNLMGINCPNEAEFRAYQILMNLNEGDILWEIQQKPDWVRISKDVQLAIKIHMAMFEKNYAQFFKLVRAAPYLTACILHRYFFQVRSTALRTIFKAYSIHNKSENYTSLSAVQRVLGFAEDKPNLFQYFCSAHGVSCDFAKDRITLSRKTFDMPDCPSITREYYLIESKLDQPINVILNGGPLGKNPYPDHCPHTSFNEQGYLIPGDLIGVPMKSKDGKLPTVHPLPPPPPSKAAPVHSQAVAAPAPSASASQLSDFSWTLPATTAVATTTSIFAAPLPVPPPVSAPPGRFPFKPFPSASGTGSGAGMPTNMTAFAKPVPVFAPGVSSSGSTTTSIFGGSFQGSDSSTLTLEHPKPLALEPAPPVNLFQVPERNLEYEKKLREEKLLKVADSVYNHLIAQESQRVTHSCHRQAQMEHHKKVQRQLLLEKTSHRIYSQLEQKVIENVLQMILVRRRQVQMMINRKCETLKEKLVEDVLTKTIANFAKASFEEAQEERDRKVRRLNELMKRIRLRSYVAKWRKFIEMRKEERQFRLEEKLKELENFPSYQNTHLLSSEDMLMSWCEGLEQIPRVTSPTTTQSSYSLSLCISPSKKPKLQGDELELSFTEPDGRTLNQSLNQFYVSGSAKDLDLDEAKKMEVASLIQLFDFPASSNVNQSSPASILSSWCRLQVQDENHPNTSASNKLSPTDLLERDLKKRRCDFDETELKFRES